MLDNSIKPLGDRADGARAVEITAVFEDSALGVRHLSESDAGRVTPVSWLLLALGSGFSLFSLVVAFSGQGGIGALCLAVSTATLLLAVSRVMAEKRSPHYVLGTSSGSDLPLQHPAAAAGQDLPLVRSTEQGYQLLLGPSITGVVTLEGHSIALAEYVERYGARSLDEAPQGFSIPLVDRIQCQLHLGPHTFFIRSVTAAKQMATPLLGGFKWANQVYTSLSLAAHVVLLVVVFATPPSATALTLDMFDRNNRFVRYESKALVQKDDLDSIFKKWKRPQRGGKHGGPEGASGDKKAPKRNRRMAIKSDRRGPVVIPRKTLMEQVRSAGVLGALSSQHNPRVASLFSKSDIFSGEAKEAWGQLSGELAGEAYGQNGFGLIGEGRGGGHGISDGAGFARIGKIGSGMLPGGEGRGPRVKLAPRKQRVPKVGTPQADVTGCIDKSIVRRQIRSRINEVRHCYVKGLQSERNLRGRVVVKFAIGKTGRVLTSSVARSTLKHGATELCVAKAVRRILFPAIECGLVVVRYPFVFHHTGR